MSFNFLAHLPRLFVEVAEFPMCEVKVSNFTHYFLVILFVLFLFLGIAIEWLQAICFINFFTCNGKVSDFFCIKT